MTGTESNSSFRIVGERSEWSGRRLALKVAEVEAPDGSRHQREVVRHPGAVGVVPLHDDGTITMVRQYRVAIDADMWEIPAGLRDVADEPSISTARRELVEEAGLEAAHVEHLVTFHNSPGFTDEVVIVYLATGLTEVPHDRQGIEEDHMLVERVPLEVALARVDRGEITDAKTIIALQAIARRRAAAG